MSQEELILRAARALREASGIVFTNGAGLGVDSGLPDFRGPEGFWRAYPPFRGRKFEEMSTPHWFQTDPHLAWGFFGHRYNLYTTHEPHEGYQIMIDMAQRVGDNYFVVTSNVDGHWEVAGVPPEKILEVHGSVRRLQSTDNSDRTIWNAEDSQELQNLQIDESTFRADDPLPRVRHNRSIIARPNVMMFGDWSYISDTTTDQELRFYKFKHHYETLDIQNKRLVILEIGAGEYVPTIRRLSEKLFTEQRKFGRILGGFGEDTEHVITSTLIRINPRDFQIPAKLTSIGTDDCISLSMGGLEALVAIRDTMSRLDDEEEGIMDVDVNDDDDDVMDTTID